VEYNQSKVITSFWFIAEEKQMNRAVKRVISIILASAMQLSYLPAFSAAAYERSLINENGYSAESGSDIDIYTNIYGRVTDRSGTPVEGVSVLLWSIDENKALALCETDSDGRWQSLDYDAVSGQRYAVRFYKSGYSFEENGSVVTALSQGAAMPDAVCEIEEGVVYASEDDFYYTVDEEKGMAEIKGYLGEDSRIVLPESLGGYTVGKIANNAFSGAGLEYVALPEGLEEIGAGSFKNCLSLKEVRFPNTLVKICGNAFTGCTALESVDLPDSVCDIATGAFSGCVSLGSITYPRGLEYMGMNVCSGCTALVYAAVPEGITELPANTFYGWDCLAEISLPDSLESIGSSAFKGCAAIGELKLPASLKKIGSSAFEDCVSVEIMDVPDTVSEIGAGAFSGCEKFVEFGYPKALASAGSNVFSGCVSLTVMEIPSGVSSIPSYIFSGHESLEKVVLPEGLKSIGSRAFAECASLNNIVFPDGLTEIGSSAFCDCVSLKEADLPDSVSVIGARAFQNCISLESFRYPLGWSDTAGHVFSGCSALEHIDIPEGVAELPAQAFRGSDSLVSVSLPSTLISIDEYSFAECPALDTVILPDSAVRIENNAFYGCSGLERIWIGGNVSNIHINSFDGCDRLTIYGDEGTFAEEYASEQGIPFWAGDIGEAERCLEGRVVLEDGTPLSGVHVDIYEIEEDQNIHSGLITAEDGSWAIEDAEVGRSYRIMLYKQGYIIENDISFVTMGLDAVTLEAAEAKEAADLDFSEAGFTFTVNTNKGTASVTGYTGSGSRIAIPETLGGYPVCEIGAYAFRNNISLTAVSLPVGVTSIGNYAFSGCTSLELVQMPNGVNTINSYAFSGCAALRSFDYPLCWSYSGGHILDDSGVTDISVPEGTLAVPQNAFMGHSGLESIVLPAGLKEIGASAFSGCSRLNTVDFPEGLEVIGVQAFQNCTGMTLAELPDSVCKIGQSAFSGCSALESFRYPSSLEEAGTFIFAGCSGITEIIVPEGITAIPSNMFYGAEHIQNIDLPETLVSVGSSAFNGCVSITEMILPENLTQINTNAFKGCAALKEIDIPASVTSIGGGAFSGCLKLERVGYPAGLKEAWSGIWENCPMLTSMIVPEGTLSIPANTFRGADSLTYIGLPEGLVSVGDYAFAYCEGLETLILPESLESIGNHAFRGSSELRRLWIGEKVNSIGSYAFTDCGNLTIYGIEGSYAESYAIDNNIPFSTEEIGFDQAQMSGSVLCGQKGIKGVSVAIYDLTDSRFVFDGLTTDEDGKWSIEGGGAGHSYRISFYKEGYVISPETTEVILIPGGLDIGAVYAEADSRYSCNADDYTFEIDGTTGEAKLTGYTGDGGYIIIPADHEGYPVTSIGEGAFEGNDKLIGVYIPASIRTVGSRAFKGCTALCELNLPNRLAKVGGYAFSDCTSLAEVILPESVTHIYGFAFCGCTMLKAVDLPLSWSFAEGFIFKGCSGLTEISLDDGATVVPDSAFTGAESLEKVVLPEGIETIGHYAFRDCVSLADIELPDSLVTVRNHVFAGCVSIRSMSFPAGLKDIGAGAFLNCTGLETIDYPIGWEKSGTDVFGGCTSLNRIVIPEGVVSIPDNAFNGSCVSEVSFPESLKSIGNAAFRGTLITEAALPDGLEKIGSYAFAYCAELAELVYPVSLIEGGMGAFAGCTKLTEISVPSGVKALPDNVFWGMESLISLTLPEGLVSIGENALRGCTSLETISFPEGLEAIGGYAFYGCTALTEAELPDSVNSIGTRAFQDCTALSRISYPAYLSETGDYVFYGCISLEEVDIPEGTMQIPSGVFRGAPALRTVRIPASVEYIGSYAFENCPELRFALIPRNVKKVGIYSFHNCPQLRYILVLSGSAVFGQPCFGGREDLVMYCGMRSIAAAYGIDNGITVLPFDTEETDDALGSGDKGYYADSSAVNINGIVSFSIFWDIDNEIWSGFEEEPVLYISIPDSVVLDEASLTLDGVVLSDYEYNSMTGIVAIPITSAAGRLTYSAYAVSSGSMASYALIAGILNGERVCSVLGITLFELDAFTITVPSVVSDSLLEISGAAPPMAEVRISADGIEKTIVKANRAGSYHGKIELEPTNTEQVFVISASCTDEDGTERTASGTVLFRENAPRLTSFDFYQHGRTHFDLLSASEEGIRTAISHYGHDTPHRFEVTFSDHEAVYRVMVVSTRSNIRKVMEAHYDEAKDAFVAEGVFGDPSYVPGTLSVEYTLADKDISEEPVDWAELYAGISEGFKAGVRADGETLDLSGVPGFENTEISIALSETADEDCIWIEAGRMTVVSDGILLEIDTSSDITELAVKLLNITGMPRLLCDRYGIYTDFDALRSAVMQSSYIADKISALELADKLEDEYTALVVASVLIPVIYNDISPLGERLINGIIAQMEEASGVFEDGYIMMLLGAVCLIKWYIDPSGYVYDLLSGERLNGAVVSAYCVEYDGSENFWDESPSEDTVGTLWNAHEFDQLNPLVTDEEGKYAWDVPEGWWRVVCRMEGYEDAHSAWLPVPPPQTSVNIGMMPKIKEAFGVAFDGGVILVSSSFETEQNISVVTAIYGSDNCMIKAEVHDAVLEKGEIIEIAAPNADGNTIKCFILDKNSFEPLKEAAIFEINN